VEPLQIIVDRRIRVPSNGLTVDVIAELKEGFEHKNPEFFKRLNLGLPLWKIPRVIRTWEEESKWDKNWITFPRGGLARVREVLDSYEIDRSITDKRTLGESSLLDPMPDHNVELYPYQVEMRDKGIEAQTCILKAGTGCLAGETIVRLSRAGKGFSLRLDRLVHMFNGGRTAGLLKGGGGGRTWDPKIPTMVQIRDENGFVRLAKLADAYESGRRLTWVLTTERGRSIRATLDHRFLTQDGWKPLRELRVDDLVYTSAGRSNAPNQRERGERKQYLVRSVAYHPHATRVKNRVPLHRLIAEANLNGLSLEAFLERVRAGQLKHLLFLDPNRFHVHHLDEDSLNNALDNLVIKPSAEHRRDHGLEGTWQNVALRTGLDRVKSIACFGEEPTYDLAMESPPHNFVADDFVVHNSGKTTVAFAIAGKLKLPTLVMVSTRALFDQWVTRAQKEMGLKKKEIGIIRGSTMRLAVLTIAMQKTLSLRVPFDEDLAKFFGCFIVDEVQLAAASTFIKAIDPVHAKYRIGISADHRRKDGKEFLVLDEFGAVAHEVTRQQLIDSKHIVDTEIRVIPTEFAAPWYGMPTDDDDGEVPNDEKEVDFGRLLLEMNDNEPRNDRILQAIDMGLEQGEQVLVMAHRREHCRVVDQQLVRKGIKTGFLIGGDDYRKQFVETRELFEKGKLQVAVGTFQAIGYGIDLPKAAVVVCATPIAGNRFFFNQVRGRICRLAKNKKDSWVYYLWDKQVYGLRHVRNLIKWNNKRVQVWTGEAGWVDGKTYLKMEKENAKAQ
jgi:hypothetical protein